MSEQPVHVKMLIGGSWTDGADLIEVRNPANPDEVVGTAICGTAADVERAIAAAKSAQPGWAKRSFAERANIDWRSAGAVLGGDGGGSLYARENGRVLAEALGELRGVPLRNGLLELAPEL